MPNKLKLKLDHFLSQLMIRRMVNEQHNISSRLAPFIQVGRKTDSYLKFDSANTRLENSALDARGGSNEVDFGYDTDTYRISDYGFKMYIHPDLINEVEPEIANNLREVVAQTLTDLLSIDKEYRTSRYFTDTNIMSGRIEALTNQTAVDNENSPILDIIDNILEDIRVSGGKEANTWSMNKKVWRKVRRHPDLLKKMSDDSIRSLTIPQIKQILDDEDTELSNILIAKQTYNITPEGRDPITGKELDPVFKDIWDDSMLFSYTDQNQKTVMENTFAKSFIRNQNGVQIFFYNDPDPDVEGIWCKAKTNYGFKITNKYLGKLVTNVLKVA